jgi:hypothetical protein
MAWLLTAGCLFLMQLGRLAPHGTCGASRKGPSVTVAHSHFAQLLAQLPSSRAFDQVK